MQLSPYHYEDEFGSCWKLLFLSPRTTVLLPWADLKWPHRNMMAVWMVQPTNVVHIELNAFHVESPTKHKNRFRFSIISHQWNGTCGFYVEDKDILFCLNQCYWCWWSGNTKSQGISSNDLPFLWLWWFQLQKSSDLVPGTYPPNSFSMYCLIASLNSVFTCTILMLRNYNKRKYIFKFLEINSAWHVLMQLSHHHYEEDIGSHWKLLFQSPWATVLLLGDDLKWLHHNMVAVWMVQPAILVDSEFNGGHAELIEETQKWICIFNNFTSMEWYMHMISTSKTGICVFQISNVMVVDELVMQQTKALTAMVWHFCPGYGGFSTRSVQIYYHVLTHIIDLQVITWLHLSIQPVICLVSKL